MGDSHSRFRPMAIVEEMSDIDRCDCTSETFLPARVNRGDIMTRLISNGCKADSLTTLEPETNSKNGLEMILSIGLYG